jgi:hypothetical protein
MYKISKGNNIFKMIKGMCRRGTLRLKGNTMTGFIKRPEVNKSVKETIIEWKEFYEKKFE